MRQPLAGDAGAVCWQTETRRECPGFFSLLFCSVLEPNALLVCSNALFLLFVVIFSFFYIFLRRGLFKFPLRIELSVYM